MLVKNYKGILEELILYNPFDDIFVITSKFGRRWGKRHNGFDIVPKNRSRITIRSVGWSIIDHINYQGFGAGNFVVFKSLYYPGVELKFFHLKNPPIHKVGWETKGKEYFGVMGNTGASMGAHLHLEIWVDGKPINPELVKWI